MKYKVSRQGEELGSFDLDQIATMIRAREIELFDYIFDEDKNDWILLMEHPGVTAKLKSNKPGKPPKKETTAEPRKSTTETVVTAEAPVQQAAAGGEWFVLKGEHRFGPFEFAELIRMLQQKVVYPFDFVWHAGLSDWKRLAELPEFQPDAIRGLMAGKDKKTSEVFVPRKHKRKKHNTRVIIHDNLSLWKGQSFEVSKGGLGVTLTNALVVPGQQVFLHFSGGEGWPTFNAVCEVVSKTYVDKNAPVQYGLKFLSVSQEALAEFQKKVS